MKAVRLVDYHNRPIMPITELSNANNVHTLHVVVIAPSHIMPAWRLVLGVEESVLVKEGLVIQSVVQDGNVNLVMTNIERAIELLEKTGELPDIRRCLKQIKR